MAGSYWGIFDQNGDAVIAGDSVDTFSFQRDYNVATAPQEDGAFSSYNKVAQPYTPRVSYLVGVDRTDFLQSLDAACASLELYTATSPDASYPNANLIHYDYTRTQRQGATLLIVNVWLEEIRAGTGPTLNSTASINGADPRTSGPNQSLGTGPNGSDYLKTGLSSPSGATSSTSLTTPTIGPAVYNATNLPQVPNTWSTLSTGQQQSVVAVGNTYGAEAANVYSNSYSTPNGAITATLFSQGSIAP